MVMAIPPGRMLMSDPIFGNVVRLGSTCEYKYYFNHGTEHFVRYPSSESIRSGMPCADGEC